MDHPGYPAPSPPPSQLFFHGMQALPVAQASTRDVKPYLVCSAPSTITKHLVLSESEQDAPDRRQPRQWLLKKL